MSPFQQVLANAKLALACLSISLFLSVLLNIFLSVSLASSPKSIKVALWQLKEGATEVSYGQLIPSSAFGFAQNIWINLNNWPDNGFVDAPSKIKALKARQLVSNQFIMQYAALLKNIQTQGFAKDYRQVTQSDAGGFFKKDQVIKDGNSYIVHIRSRSLFYFNDKSSDEDKGYQGEQDKFNALSKPLKTHPVKELVIEYALRVVPFPNEIGMSIAGIVGTPQVISQKTDLYMGDES